MESSLAFAPDFSKSGGLIAAVAQDAETLDAVSYTHLTLPTT